MLAVTNYHCKAGAKQHLNTPAKQLHLILLEFYFLSSKAPNQLRILEVLS